MTGRVEARPTSVFIAYSRKDESLKEELLKHLSALRRGGVIREWHDRLIEPGTDWNSTIDQHLNSCDIVLLLISADFIHSEYCYGFEAMRALARHERGALVIPVILRSCDWMNLPIGTLQALPTDGKPVTSWPSADDAYTDVARGLRRALTSNGQISGTALLPASLDEQPAPNLDVQGVLRELWKKVARVQIAFANLPQAGGIIGPADSNRWQRASSEFVASYRAAAKFLHTEIAIPQIIAEEVNRLLDPAMDEAIAAGHWPDPFDTASVSALTGNAITEFWNRRSHNRRKFDSDAQSLQRSIANILKGGAARMTTKSDGGRLSAGF